MQNKTKVERPKPVSRLFPTLEEFKAGIARAAAKIKKRK